MMLSTCMFWSIARDISCSTSLCRTDRTRAEYCCSKGDTGCCRYSIGSGGGWNNGGSNGGSSNSGGNGNNGGNDVNEGSNGGNNQGGNWNNGGNNNNNKPGTCPPYNGRRRRSADPC